MIKSGPKQRGDRRDAYLVRDNDPMHLIMPYLMGERADNEAVLTEQFELAKVKEYLAKKSETAQYKYTYFHFILAAMAKTIYFRPKMNRFYTANRLYERDNISFSFTAKNKFNDHADESLLVLKAEDNETSILEQMHDKVCAEVYKIREEEKHDDTTTQLEWLTKIPRPILKLVVKLLFWLQYHDWLPAALNNVDPYRSTVWISNLGSIKTSANYHHLINWSLCSIFVIENKSKIVPVFAEDGTYEMKEVMDISFTIDERIADGFYFARSVELFKTFFENPELIDQPLSAPLPENK